MKHPRTLQLTSPCAKRGYRSVRAAKAAHRYAGWRVRVYSCPDCRLFHVANAEKDRGGT